MLREYVYGGSILIVDLSSGKVEKEPTENELIEKFLGGEGFALALAERYLKPKIDPLSPDNVFIIAPGALCGTLCVPAGKVTGVCKATLPAREDGTCYVASARAGTSFLGAMIKNAGYDAIVIKGRAKEPSYLEIIDDKVKILSAEHLWKKKNIYETNWELMNRYGRCGTLAIGKAGENLVTWSMATADTMGTMGRDGHGAVMGSKNLKAIVVKGSKGVKVADLKRFMKATNKIQKTFLSLHPFIDWGHKTGYNAFWFLFMITLNQGNMKLYEFDCLNNMDVSEKYIKVLKACAGCPFGCHMETEIQEGKFRGQMTPFGHFLLPNMMTNRLGLKDLNQCDKLFKDCSDSGLCGVTYMAMADWITRMYLEGRIPKGKHELEFTRDFDSYYKLLHLIINREGIGDILADGFFAAGKEFGIDATKDTVMIGLAKGRPVTYDARFTTLDPLRFTYITNPRPQHAGAHMLTVVPTNVPQFPVSIDMIKDNFSHMGIPKDVFEKDFTPVPYYGVGFNVARLTVEGEHSRNIVDSLGTCSVYTAFNVGTIEDYAEIYSAATGIEMTASELRTIGERVFNLYKALNVKEGFDRRDDWIDAWMTPRLTPEGIVPLMDYWRTRIVSSDDLNHLLDDYYEKRGWNIERGIPTIEKLQSLGLEKSARDFKKMGIF
jgi:aldehyde:ferredoxin oxidoreductase